MPLNVLCRGDCLVVSGDLQLTYLLPPGPADREREYTLLLSDGARIEGAIDRDGWHWLALTRHANGKTQLAKIGPESGFTHDALITDIDLILNYEPVVDSPALAA